MSKYYPQHKNGRLILITALKQKMKRLSKKNEPILRSVGMFIIATSQIVSHFIELPDFTKGLFVGVGIGMLLLSIFFGKFTTV